MLKIIDDIDLYKAVGGAEIQLGNGINSYDGDLGSIVQHLDQTPAADPATGVFILEHRVPGLERKL